MQKRPTHVLTRRQFVTTSAVASASLLAAPAVHATRKSDSQVIVGAGEHQFEALHHWPQLPAPYTWQTTHNVAVDRAGCLYVIHEGDAAKPDHPAIFVFDPAGRFLRAFGQQFQGGGHGIEVREESGQEFLYVCAYQQVKAIAKLDLHGELVWWRHAPMQSGRYAAGEDTNPQKIWGRDRFMPTNFAFLPDGDLLVADGYGAYCIHRYDKEGQWKSCFGGPGDGTGTFDTPHGVWVDARDARVPRVVVTDRAHHTLQLLSVAGAHEATLDGFGLPANADIQGDLMVVPELLGRVSLLGRDNQVVARLGDNSQEIRGDTSFAIRGDAGRWKPGYFVHPHDACFAADGSIFVAEWVATGRVTKLRKLS
jgi:hypothetical protein